LGEGSGTVAQYEYDGAKRRSVKKYYTAGVLSETRHLYYTEPSKWQAVEERIDMSADADRQFAWGLRYIDDLVVRDRDTNGGGTLDERLYPLQDSQWNVTAIATSGGTIEERYSYSAYGIRAILTPAFVLRTDSVFSWEFTYAGYRFDVETGCHYVRHRIYHPLLSWIQRDPLGLTAGVNVYQYADGNPLIYSDPMGRLPPAAIIAVLGNWLAACGIAFAVFGKILVIAGIIIVVVTLTMAVVDAIMNWAKRLFGCKQCKAQDQDEEWGVVCCVYEHSLSDLRIEEEVVCHLSIQQWPLNECCEDKPGYDILGNESYAGSCGS
jgi:RHS repeat-associated protein